MRISLTYMEISFGEQGCATDERITGRKGNLKKSMTSLAVQSSSAAAACVVPPRILLKALISLRVHVDTHTHTHTHRDSQVYRMDVKVGCKG
ncbi:hypothetical protein NHX12_010840 [Muraenolepis orangiensis]|uniref:Uncharacterized protein n=1 Tax=Muraenolepis orangiensis TaxID=630683 RepID=A0A9Q0DFA3_9TELE|nr:hypothetical protein NHX12_010840 [Muraenolepis orangiensis]